MASETWLLLLLYLSVAMLVFVNGTDVKLLINVDLLNWLIIKMKPHHHLPYNEQKEASVATGNKMMFDMIHLARNSAY